MCRHDQKACDWLEPCGHYPEDYGADKDKAFFEMEMTLEDDTRCRLLMPTLRGQ